MSSVRVRSSSLYTNINNNNNFTNNSIPLRPLSRTVTTIRNSSTYPSRPPIRPSPFPLHNNVNSITLEGDQADLIIPNDQRHPQRGSVLSLASFMSDQSFASTNENDHDHDIVDHLEVIDPTIATVSNLANAANAILIPPIGLYSRKPVIFLPRHTAKASAFEDAEKGSTLQHNDIDRHFEQVLGKRAKFLRTLQGVWSFLKTPMGIVTAVYGFLVAFWGAAIVLILAKIINFHDANTQGFWVEVSSQVENGLFTITGVGLLPWRVVDTYRIRRIWHYKRLTRTLRRGARLPELYDEDDLPDPMYDPNYIHVLSQREQDDLHYQQQQFMKSQTWYRPHGTTTHRAFPIHQALLICCLIDGNSFFQCILCTTMWSLNRFQRPPWSTGILIPASFLCGIFAAVLIWRGGQLTKRTKEVEERLRLALTMESDAQKAEIYRDALISELPKNCESSEESEVIQGLTGSTHNNNLSDKRRVSSILIEERMDIPSLKDPPYTHLGQVG